MRQVHDVLGRSVRFQIPIFVCEPDDRVGVSYVHPLGVVSRRIEGDAIRLVESGDINFFLPRVTRERDSAEDSDFSAAALRQENVAVGGGPDQPGIIKPRGELLHLKSGWSLWPCALRTADHLRSIV